MQKFIMSALILASCAAQADDTVVARLHSARTLRCTMNWSMATSFIPDGERNTQTSEKLDARYTFDNIDLKKGTARMIGDAFSHDVTVRWESNALWLTSKTPFGMELMMVFPQYARNTNDFIFVNASFNKEPTAPIFATQTYGLCSILQ